MEFEIKNNTLLRQFETKIEGKLIKIEYSEQPKKIFLTSFSIDESLDKNKYQEAFILAIFDKLADEDQKVFPTSSIIANVFKKHRHKYKHLLPMGISL
jgi:hypothetical protein